MPARNPDKVLRPHANVDEALASVFERLSDYVVITPRDTSLPIPLLGAVTVPPQVRLANRAVTPSEQAVNTWQRVGACMWWALPPQEEFFTSVDHGPE